MSEWKKIDTAPKDGTEIIGVYVNHYDDGTSFVDGPFTIHWDNNHDKWVPSCDGYRVIESQSDWGTEYMTIIQPTHWQPFPDTSSIKP